LAAAVDDERFFVGEFDQRQAAERILVVEDNVVAGVDGIVRAVGPGDGDAT
jgi:hypothetical protein